MPHSSFWLQATDGTSLYVNQWLPAQAPRAVLMLAHGMAEHSARYARFADFLNLHGIGLFGHDQRGHGQTAQHGLLGHYADHHGWHKVVGDLASLNHHIRQQFPRTPILLYGHSMGSYIGMAYLMQHSCSLQGAILSGSNYQASPLKYLAARSIARLESLRQGRRGRSRLLNWLTFGRFNQACQPRHSAFDWLSRDAAEVQRYLDDPLCGFLCTNQLWLDLLGGLLQISQMEQLAQIDPQLPLLVTGGQCDPVSQGRRLQELAEALRLAGAQQVSLHVYEQARHELLNEINRQQVSEDLLAWIELALQHPRCH